MEQNKQKLPNSTATLVLGMLSMVFCWGYLILPIILSIISLSISKKAIALVKEDPERYFGYSNIKTGRICAYIGISLSIIWILYCLVAAFIYGTSAFNFGFAFGNL